MSGAAREKDQGDFDLERFVDMMDEAMTSEDPRVIETLRRLMMIVVMTRPEDKDHFAERKTGPLRQMYDDVRSCHRRISDIEDTLHSMSRQLQAGSRQEYQVDKDIYIKKQTAAQIAQHNLPNVTYQIEQAKIAAQTAMSADQFRNMASTKGLLEK